MVIVTYYRVECHAGGVYIMIITPLCSFCTHFSHNIIWRYCFYVVTYKVHISTFVKSCCGTTNFESEGPLIIIRMKAKHVRVKLIVQNFRSS